MNDATMIQRRQREEQQQEDERRPADDPLRPGDAAFTIAGTRALVRSRASLRVAPLRGEALGRPCGSHSITK
jgi:hypothetical protein